MAVAIDVLASARVPRGLVRDGRPRRAPGWVWRSLGRRSATLAHAPAHAADRDAYLLRRAGRRVRRVVVEEAVAMTKRRKRPRDPIQLAKLIGDIATGQVEDRVEDARDPAAVELGRRGGLKGGKARAAKLSPAKRKAIA